MRIRQLQWGDRGISIVIGTVLLVGIVTITMAILATAILGTDFIDRSPEADIVYEEDQNGTVLIALADARGLSAGNTELQLRGAGSCGSWDGDGTLGKGSVTLLEGSDCPDSLEEGDVIQVISSGTLVDTYELRGVSLGLCEEAIDDGSLTITSGEELTCNLGDDSERVDVDLTMHGGELNGMANLSMAGSLDLHGGTINGDVDSERISELETEWTITGDFRIPDSAESDTVALKRDTEVGERILSEKRSVSLTDAYVGDGVTVTGTDELLKLEGESSIDGDVLADRNTVRIGSDSIITGPVTAGEVTLESRSTVENTLDADDDVTLKSNAVVRNDVTGVDVLLKDGATIEGDATASTITCEGSATVEGTVDADENNGC
ncbi:polymer-forming cytoskeletal protein [Haloterrigena sp. SYSU A558-1]|uniref:Polymer-forming cytoskeletal protein n=1 Tax=Haloterrigena gelatinilytica TaxID=2741724 RepID=A0ABX2LA68_9EURY|nr:polymer-forming cytoskeletal protein [Haloterrigena gelatinilytica]NUC73165.1 polymer-forming cytoskeletal protein [Haloterrigena gelatinilytica]